MLNFYCLSAIPPDPAAPQPDHTPTPANGPPVVVPSPSLGAVPPAPAAPPPDPSPSPAIGPPVVVVPAAVVALVAPPPVAPVWLPAAVWFPVVVVALAAVALAAVALAAVALAAVALAAVIFCCCANTGCWRLLINDSPDSNNAVVTK